MHSYSMGEWLTVRPLVHRFKYARTKAITRAYVACGAGVRDRFLAGNPGLAEGSVAVTIAFNTPWVIDLFLRSARLYLANTTIIVADNSSKREARAEIASLCRAQDVAYVALPANPGWGPNRSHGLALNWVYHNLIRTLDPPIFAFLDHDLFAIEPFDLAEPLRKQPIYGRRLAWGPQPGPWTLWAGYCVYDQVALGPRILDFNNDSGFRLDTGGYNWWRLYRDLDPEPMKFATRTHLTLHDPDDRLPHAVTKLDAFVHVRGASHRADGKAQDRIAFFQRLISYFERGGHWSDLVLAEEAWSRTRRKGSVASDGLSPASDRGSH